MEVYLAYYGSSILSFKNKKIPQFPLKTIKLKITENGLSVFSWIIFLNFLPPTADQPRLRLFF